MKSNLFWRILGYDIEKSKIELKQINSLSEEKFWELQLRKRDSILMHHLENSPWYKNYTKDINHSNWSEIPVIKKTDLQNYSSKEKPNKLFNNIYFANTSGSSGHPLLFWKNRECHSFAWAKIQISYEILGITQLDKEARFLGHIKDSYKTKYLELLKDKFLNRFRFDVFNISEDRLMDYYNTFKKESFNYIYGYTNVIINFSKFIIKNKLPSLKEICPSIKVCIVTAEMCTEEDRNLIEKAFGISIYREYGSSETSIIAIENKKLKWEISTDRLWVEVVDENNNILPNGELGRIILTDLNNKVFPFVRYDIGDFGRINKINKHPYLLLNELSGRISDLIYLPSGKKAPGLTFYYISRTILEKTNNIKEFKIVQTAINKFKFLIISEKELRRKEKNELLKATYNYLEPGLKIEFEKIKEFEKCYSGKVQHFFSEIREY